ncbi:MAG: ABC transporter permease [Coriobacteriia bacterium]|nr:ABC transporter permease [Coriobacteriia bacterium]MBN2822164.1 ABC transporter permease [Coriobacteriia bacterium]
MIRKIVAIGWLNVQQMMRNPAELVGVILLPVALTLVFGSAFGSGEARPLLIPVVNEDGSSYATQVSGLIDAEESFEVTSVSREEAERRVREGDNALAVIVPDGFGEEVESGDAAILIMRNPASENAFAAMAVIEGVAVRMSADVAAANLPSRMPFSTEPSTFAERYRAADGLWEPAPPVSVVGETVVASDVRGDSEFASNNTQYSTGFTVMFIMFVTFGGASGILEEREQGTLRRLLITPNNKMVLVVGKIFGIVMTAVIQTLILVGIGAVVFSVPWGNAPLAVVLLFLSYILAVTGLAILLSALVRSRDQLSGLMPLLSVGLAMLGGSFWPLQIVSPVMQTIAKLTPTGWAMIGLTDVVARNQGMQAALLPAAVLLGFAAVSLGLGARLLKFE